MIATMYCFREFPRGAAYLGAIFPHVFCNPSHCVADPLMFWLCVVRSKRFDCALTFRQWAYSEFSLMVAALVLLTWLYCLMAVDFHFSPRLRQRVVLFLPIILFEEAWQLFGFSVLIIDDCVSNFLSVLVRLRSFNTSIKDCFKTNHLSAGGRFRRSSCIRATFLRQPGTI